MILVLLIILAGVMRKQKHWNDLCSMSDGVGNFHGYLG